MGAVSTCRKSLIKTEGAKMLASDDWVGNGSLEIDRSRPRNQSHS